MAWGRTRTALAVLVAAAAVAAAPALGSATVHDALAALVAPRGVCGAAADRSGLGRRAAERTMLCLTNYARRRAGLRPLALSTVLDRLAEAKLRADVRCGQFSHTPCGRPFAAAYARFFRARRAAHVGENIAWGTGPLATPRETIDEWIHSPEHRANILAPDYRRLGVGYLARGRFLGYAGASLWSQEFASR